MKKLLIFILIFFVAGVQSVFADEPTLTATDSAGLEVVPTATTDASLIPTITPTFATNTSTASATEITTATISAVSTISQTPIAASSAVIKGRLMVLPLETTDFQANEPIVLQLGNVEGHTITVHMIEQNTKEELAVGRAQTVTGQTTTLTLLPPMNFVPGVYTLTVADEAGKVFDERVSWGVVALSFDAPVYAPRATAHIGLEVLDQTGAAYCGAAVKLTITDPNGKDTNLSTQKSSVLLNPFCGSHRSQSGAGYTVAYKTGGNGMYRLKALIATGSESYTVRDTFTVSDTLPVTVTQQVPTRVYSSRSLPVTFTVTAREDFSGTISQAVPTGLTVSPFEGAEFTTQVSTTSAYLNTGGQVLGDSVVNLSLPFSTLHPVTLGFGQQEPDTDIRQELASTGLTAHDGIDFSMPVGTEILAVDEGNVLPVTNDYGTTVVIEHAWGKSIYGHLSEVKVSPGQKVKKGDVIALSGNSGLSSGPHLHFGILPNNSDRSNGYFGKVDPIQYLTALSATSYPTKVMSWNVKLKKGENVTLGYSLSAEETSGNYYFFSPIHVADTAGSASIAGSKFWQLPVDHVEVTGDVPDFSKNTIKELLSSDGLSVMRLVDTATKAENLYALDNTNGEVWHKIADKKSMDTDSPIALKNGTAFWMTADNTSLSAFNISSGESSSITVDPSQQHVFFVSGDMTVVYKNNAIVFTDTTTQKNSASDNNTKESAMLKHDLEGVIGSVAGTATQKEETHETQ